MKVERPAYIEVEEIENLRDACDEWSQEPRDTGVYRSEPWAVMSPWFRSAVDHLPGDHAVKVALTETVALLGYDDKWQRQVLAHARLHGVMETLQGVSKWVLSAADDRARSKAESGDNPDPGDEYLPGYVPGAGYVTTKVVTVDRPEAEDPRLGLYARTASMLRNMPNPYKRWKEVEALARKRLTPAQVHSLARVAWKAQCNLPEKVAKRLVKDLIPYRARGKAALLKAVAASTRPELKRRPVKAALLSLVANWF